eukprot:CAMPEP_0175966278 /NCGR_PEP_ID=MMETSP0108-20121206/38589_1 /TAXON_ID=195067 ORGANISM="Goniomonas pacifica, Strain CCMP1869" /NCGR_SAMPLE_ID=MMETSP0108 /ASSEMBLY_ACC=CAM_ASM_000204 /LENGTH=135 /DNA_ID=CAMNT_0017294475 /DNA_START=22 /DNA_END=427 /DNA_ORIENTATION=+
MALSYLLSPTDTPDTSCMEQIDQIDWLGTTSSSKATSTRMLGTADMWPPKFAPAEKPIASPNCMPLDNKDKQDSDSNKTREHALIGVLAVFATATVALAALLFLQRRKKPDVELMALANSDLTIRGHESNVPQII